MGFLPVDLAMRFGSWHQLEIRIEELRN